MSLSICIPRQNLERAVLKVNDALVNRDTENISWTTVPEEQLWGELVSCILGSRVSYELSKACAEHLNKTGLLDPSFIIKNPQKAQKLLARELGKPIFPTGKKDKVSRYRFPKSKSLYIVKTCLELYQKRESTVRSILEEASNGGEARENLSKICCGIGLKQASLFLRNISYSKGLAIIDSHVARYIEIMGIYAEASDTKDHKANYLQLEQLLQQYANKISKNLATLDIAIWVVMRVALKGS